MAEEKQLISSVFTYESLVHAVAGAVGSTVGLTVFFPLDTARTRLQVDHGLTSKGSFAVIAEIAEEDGVAALYRGWFPVVSSLCCSNFVYFYCYNCLKVLTGFQGKDAHPAKDLSMALIAGVINVLVTTPLWVVNTRLKLQGVRVTDGKDNEKKPFTYNGIWDCFRKVLGQEGVGALWSGTAPSLVLVANPAIQFMVYEALKRYFQKILQTQELNGLIYFIMGALAKMVATVLTYPMQVLQTQLRAGYGKQQYGKKGLLQMLLQIVRARGIAGMFKGLEAKMLQTVLMAALMFMTYEEITATVFQLMGHRVLVKS